MSKFPRITMFSTNGWMLSYLAGEEHPIGAGFGQELTATFYIKFFLYIDDELIEKVVRLSNSKTKKQAIITALEEYVRSKRIADLRSMIGNFQLDLTLKELSGSEVKNKILADTSAWICTFAPVGFDDIKKTMDMALAARTLATTGTIWLELLQGTRTKDDFDRLKTNLEALIYLPTPESTWEKAAELSFSLRRMDITVPTTDLIIAVVAIDNECELLHHDQHFNLIAQHSKLKLREI